MLIAWLSDRTGKRKGITQLTLLLSAVMTVLLVQHSSLTILFYANLLLYGAFVQARGALTQTMIGDYASEELIDAAFSIYYFVGFISGPIWTLIIGYVMQHYGFHPGLLYRRRHLHRRHDPAVVRQGRSQTSERVIKTSRKESEL